MLKCSVLFNQSNPRFYATLTSRRKFLLDKRRRINEVRLYIYILYINIFYHTTPIFRDIHWLPIQFHIQFKVIYKALHHLYPPYISSLLTPVTPVKDLRSRTSITLLVPWSNCAFFGDRAFSVVAPKLWNALPTSILDASFKSLLKTHLFRAAFPTSV